MASAKLPPALRRDVPETQLLRKVPTVIVRAPERKVVVVGRVSVNRRDGSPLTEKVPGPRVPPCVMAVLPITPPVVVMVPVGAMTTVPAAVGRVSCPNASGVTAEIRSGSITAACAEPFLVELPGAAKAEPGRSAMTKATGASAPETIAAGAIPDRNRGG